MTCQGVNGSEQSFSYSIGQIVTEYSVSPTYISDFASGSGCRAGTCFPDNGFVSAAGERER
jgi:hypothetical protein